MTPAKYSLLDLAKAAGMPESTTRRYCRLFREYIPIEERGRVKFYHKDAIPILHRVKELFKEGYNSDEINSLLINEFPRAVDVDWSEDDEMDVAEGVGPYHIVSALLKQLQANKHAKEEVQALKKAVVRIRDHLVKQEEKQKALPNPKDMDQILGRLDRMEEQIRVIDERVSAMEGKRTLWDRIRGKKSDIKKDDAFDQKK